MDHKEPIVTIINDTEVRDETERQQYEAFSKTLYEQGYKLTAAQIAEYLHQKHALISSLDSAQINAIDAIYPEPIFVHEDPEITDAVASIFSRTGMPIEAAGGAVSRMLQGKGHSFLQDFLTAIRERSVLLQERLHKGTQDTTLVRDGVFLAEIERHIDLDEDDYDELPLIDATQLPEITPGAQAIHRDITVVSETLGALDPDTLANHRFSKEMQRSSDPNEAVKNLRQALATAEDSAHRDALEYAKNLARSRELVEQYFPFIDSRGIIDGDVITKLRTYFDQLSSRKVNGYPLAYLAPIFAHYVRTVRNEAAETLEREVQTRSALELQTIPVHIAEITRNTQIELHTSDIDKINPLIAQADQFLEELEAITDDTIAPNK